MASTNRPRRTILVTGFGGFPGSPRNPSQRLVARLDVMARRLDRLGVVLQRDILPVVYDDGVSRMGDLVACHRPDVILHLGVAGRRRQVCVELRATCHVSPLHVDAAGRRPEAIRQAGGPLTIRATYSAPPLLALLRQSGLPARLSHDAGDYVCNATLYRSLTHSLAPAVGFIHVPRPRRTDRPSGRTRSARPSEAALLAGIERILLALARRPLHCMRSAATRPHTDTMASVSVARSSLEMVKAGVR